MYLIAKQRLDLKPPHKPDRINSSVHRGRLSQLVEMIVTLVGGTWFAGPAPDRRRMQVVETLSVGPKKQLLLIRVDGEKYLVATGADNVQSIQRIERGIAESKRIPWPPEIGERP